MIHNITLGSDPEFAAYDENGVPKSAVGFIPGTKQEPYPMTEDGSYSCQIDNVGVETCIPPCRTKDEFVNAVLTSKDLAEKELQKLQPNWSIRSKSSEMYSDLELSSKTARTFGCDPSWDVYSQGISPRPSPDEVGNLRSFGFHIHIGFQSEDPMRSLENIIKMMDITCGVGSLLIDNDTRRRSIYGNPGDFRFRQVDDITIVEYRTLGGAMHRDEETIGWVYDQTMKAISMASNWKDEYDDIAADAASIIKDGDNERAVNFLTQYEIQIPYTYDYKYKVTAS